MFFFFEFQLCSFSNQWENRMIRMKFACVILILCKYLVSSRLKMYATHSHKQWVHHGTLNRSQLSVLDELESAAILDFRDKVSNPPFCICAQIPTKIARQFIGFICWDYANIHLVGLSTLVFSIVLFLITLIILVLSLWTGILKASLDNKKKTTLTLCG